MDVSAEEFLYFQSQSLDYLYGIMPVPNDSLFIAEFSGVKNAKYRVKTITIPVPEITFETNDNLCTSYPKKVNWKDDLTIVWYEDAFNSVQKYHLNLMGNTALLSAGIFRKGAAPIHQLTINKYTYMEGNEAIDTPFDSIPIPVLTDTIVIDGIQPYKIPEITLDSGGGGEIKTISISYKVQRISYTGPNSMKSEISDGDFSGITQGNTGTIVLL